MVGAAPPTMRRLQSNKVRTDEMDPNFSAHETIEAANHSATSMSASKGFNGELMKVVLNGAAFDDEPITMPFAEESVKQLPPQRMVVSSSN